MPQHVISEEDMRFDTWVFLLLMILKTFTVIPLAAKNMGLPTAIGFMVLNVLGYGTLMYLSIREGKARKALARSN
jgi:hypothetical protein